jgi:putative ABC transport system permease protein
MIMFKNYLKIALRNIRKHKGYSFINIGGLAIGVAACLLLFLWVQDELSFDRYHEKVNQIFRVSSQYEAEGKVRRFAKTSAPVGPALVSEFPEIEKAVRFGRNEFVASYQNKRFVEQVYFTDPEVFDVFTFPLVKGNPKNALREPYSIVISEEMSRKYFGDEDPLGKIITLSERRDYRITGVFRDIPTNSHFRFHFLGLFSDYASSDFDQWGISNYWTYILVSNNFSPDEFKQKSPQFVEKYRGKESRYLYKTSYPLQALTRIHLHSNLRGEHEPNSSMGIIYTFSAIAVFILLIACLNYINLSTARYVTRAKEVGLRKVVGATRPQLIKQFLGETFLFSFIALPLSVMLAELFLPLFNSLSGKKLAVYYFDNMFLLPGLAFIILCVGFASGIFPAFFISALKPVSALRGMLKASSKGSALRKSLIVSQFAISIIFLISTFIVFSQLNYMRNRNLGLDKEHVVTLPIYDKDVLGKLETIKNEFLQNSSVLSVSVSNFFPGKATWYQDYRYEGMNESENPMIRWFVVDHDFIETFGVELVDGRNFSKRFPSDVDHAYILNESAVKEIGWDTPVGKELEIMNKGPVIGVVKDFHFRPLHQKIEPAALYIYPKLFQYISVKISSYDVSRAIDFLKAKWQALVPGQTFQYSFLDEDFDNLYKAEMRLGKIFTVVTLMAIFIACLGLFGLAAFEALQRTKEMGIRKVLGASAAGIVLLLSKEFTKWVLLANIIAWPVAYYAMNRWLQNFAYRINIGPWMLILSAAVAFIVALLTVSYQAVKVSLANPVDTLRYE